jgi:hypothetical protein
MVMVTKNHAHGTGGLRRQNAPSTGLSLDRCSAAIVHRTKSGAE